MGPKIYQLPTQLTGTVDVQPNFKYMVSGDDLATITTAGYLNSLDLQTNPISSTDVLQILYNFNPQTTASDYASFTVSIFDGIITLTPSVSAGEIILPVTIGDFANWANAKGGLQDLGFSPSTANLPKVTMLQPSNGTATPLVSYIPVFYDVNGSICMQQLDTPLFANGDIHTSGNLIADNTVYSYSRVADNFFGINIASGAGTGFSSTIEGKVNLTQNTTYYMIDPGFQTATIPVFINNPVSITPGNLIVAGTIQGSLVDGGDPGSSFVKTTGQSVMQTGSQIIFDHTFPQTIGDGDAVTINNQAGIIQTNTLTTAAGTAYTFTLNNSLLTADGNIILQLQYGDNTVTNIECVLLTPPSNGSCQITLINNNSVALNGNMKVYFFIPY